MGSYCEGGAAAEGSGKGCAARGTVGVADEEGRVFVDAGTVPESGLGPS